jgi:hypothetical protein
VLHTAKFGEKFDIHSAFYRKSRPFLGGFDEIMFLSPVNTYRKLDQEPSQDSLYDILIRWWSAKTPECFNPDSPNLLALSFYPLHIIVKEYKSFEQVLYRGNKQYEYSGSEYPRSESVARYGADMRTLQKWIRRIRGAHTKIRNMREFIQTHQHHDESTTKAATVLLEDFQAVAIGVKRYGEHYQETLRTLPGVVQTIVALQSFEETANIGNLTNMALIFVPLSFTSSVFSMSAPFAPGDSHFWVYVLVAALMTTVVYLLARLSQEMGRSPYSRAKASLIQRHGC